MISVVWIACLFFLMLLVPLLGAVVYYKTHQSEILHIRQDNIRDARYFGKSFRDMIEKALKDCPEDYLQLSKSERFIDADKIKKFPEEVEDIVIAREHNLCIPDGVKVFEKEIYAAQKVWRKGSELLKLRAVYSRKDMMLSENTVLIRWADTDGTLHCLDHCNLGLSVSSAKGICIGYDCVFERLYAPVIYLGNYPEKINRVEKYTDSRFYNLGSPVKAARNVRYISDDMIDEEGKVKCTVISEFTLKVTENLIVCGDIRSHKGLRLFENVVVNGSVFAEKDIYLGENAVILGNVFSQGNIYFAEGAGAGQPGRINSVIARGEISFAGKNRVYGYVSCQKGRTEKLQEEPKEEKTVHKRYLSHPIHEKHLTFRDLPEFEHVDDQGYRYCSWIETVKIPDGAARIEESMFYQCENLRVIELPSSLEEIRPYAFAGCKRLEKVQFLQMKNLRQIGTSAFEGCENLEEVILPESLHVLGAAAFSGCKRLKKVVFEEGCCIDQIPDHCFKDCGCMETVIIPDSVRKLGVSSFYGCSVIPELKKDLEHTGEENEVE